MARYIALTAQFLDRLWPDIKGSHGYRVTLISELAPTELLELFRRMRRQMRGGVGRGTAAESRNRRRWFRKLRRRLNPPGKRFLPAGMPARLLMFTKKDCAILRSLYPERANRWLIPRERRDHASIHLKNFSFLEHPVETMRQLRLIAEAEATAQSTTINFEDVVCSDVSPFLVFGLMRQNMAPVSRGGQIKDNLRAMITAVDLSRFLYIHPMRPKPTDATFRPFPVQSRRKRGSSVSTNIALQPSTKEKLGDELVKTVEGWLRILGQTLPEDGKPNLSNMATEALDNAERHSDLVHGDGDWAIAGFLSAIGQRGSSEPPDFFCTLSIVSVGATISESISHAEDAKTIAAMEAYVAKHSRKFAPELLRTVYALQDGVSRFRQDDERSKGGVGLLEMIGFVSSFKFEPYRSNQAPRLTLISGSSCIMVKPPFGEPRNNPGEQRRLWFNQSNSLDEPPSSDHVFSLPHPFPGTIVAMRFSVEPAKPEDLGVGNADD